MSRKFTLFFPVVLLLSMLAFLSAALPALASNQVVSDCGDSGGANQLRAKLAAAQSSGGGTITFTCAGPIALNSTYGALTVTSNITIDGGSGIAISGGNATRVFIVSSGSLTLNNLTVTKGYASGDGGAISASATLNLNNTHFLDNHTADGNAGGAIRTTAALNITNSEFASNSATNGGALFVKWGGGIATVNGSNFHDNQTTYRGEGGAVMLFDGSSATVSNSTFMSNTAGYGGAFSSEQPTSNPTTLTLSNNTLSYNRTDESGGAIYNSGTMTLTGGTLSWNAGHTAGGIYNYGTASLTNVTLTSNHADSGGGGTHGVGSGGGISNGATLTLTGVTFSNNSADSMGGGLYNEGTLTGNNSTFSSNTAYSGGGIFNDSYSNSGTITLTASTFDHNGAVSGGGIYNTGTATVTNVTLSANTATASGSGGQSGDGTGGGLFNSGGAATLLNVTFKGNTTNGGGEALNNYAPGTLTLTNSLVGKASATNGSCAGTIGGSFNYADDSSCAFGSGHVVADLKLGALANNGGTTRTHLPGAGSAAIDNGTGSNCPATDQRGITRPQGLACDVGSVEVLPATPTPTRTQTSISTPTSTRTRTPSPTPTRTKTPSPSPTLSCSGKPAKPTLMAPANGSTASKAKVKLQWNAVNCAQSYKVTVKQDSKKGTTVDATTVTKLSHKTPKLAKGHTYFWFVQACSAANKCSKSSVWSFKVQ